MNDFSKSVIDNHMIRKTFNQKKLFRKKLKDELIKDGYHVHIKSYGDAFKTNNVIVGDVAEADYIITAHYDTCAQIPVPNMCTPTSFFWLLMYQIFLIVIMLLVTGVIPIALFLLIPISKSIALVIWICLLFFVSFYMVFGKANKNNYNDNTSGVVTLIEVLKRLKDQDQKKVCAIFFDNEEKGLIGSRLFLKQNKQLLKDKTIINFDCVSDGDHLFFLTKNIKDTDKVYEYYQNDEKSVTVQSKGFKYPSDQKGYPQSIAVVALNKSSKIGYYVSRIHTKRDIIFDERNIEVLVNGTIKFFQE